MLYLCNYYILPVIVRYIIYRYIYTYDVTQVITITKFSCKRYFRANTIFYELIHVLTQVCLHNF